MTIVKKILRVGLVLVAVIAVAVVAVVIVSTVTPARPVGIQQVIAPDPGHQPLAVTIVYPTTSSPGWTWLGMSGARLASDGAIDGRSLPLVVMSHGTGASATSHIDTMLALAEAGYVVAAPTHTGDNFRDDAAVGTKHWMVDRARHMARVTDYLISAWPGRSHLDPAKIGLFGYSAGGTTGLVTAGGTPDMALLPSHCARSPELVCQLTKKGSAASLGIDPGAWTHDNRIKAAVIVAPGFGFTFAPRGLDAVDVPVQLWAGGADKNTPLATNANVVRRLLPRPPEFHLVARAEHFAFMPPCGAMKPLLPPILCSDPVGFDREAFHERFNKDVVSFFGATLKPSGGVR
jgi:predicted dienelactone hydrolase